MHDKQGDNSLRLSLGHLFGWLGIKQNREGSILSKHGLALPTGSV